MFSFNRAHQRQPLMWLHRVQPLDETRFLMSAAVWELQRPCGSEAGQAKINTLIFPETRQSSAVPLYLKRRENTSQVHTAKLPLFILSYLFLYLFMCSKSLSCLNFLPWDTTLSAGLLKPVLCSRKWWLKAGKIRLFSCLWCVDTLLN